MELNVEGLAQNAIPKRPKNLFIVFNVMKQEWIKAHPEFKDWREVKTKLSDDDLITSKEVGEYAKKRGLDIPLHTAPERLAKDGRSRESRKKKKG